MDALTQYVLAATGWILPPLALWLLLRCLRSMLRGKSETEIWAYLEDDSGTKFPVRHWECIIGRAKNSDIVLSSPDAARTHAALIRSDTGKWKLYNLAKDSETAIGARRDDGHGLEVHDGNILFFGETGYVFHDMDDASLAENERGRVVPGMFISQGITLLLLTVFQVLIALQFANLLEGKQLTDAMLGFAVLILSQWCYYLIMRAMDRRGFEVETLAFFLCTLGMSVSVSSTPDDTLKQVILLLAGIFVFIFLGWWLRDLRRTRFLRAPLAVASLAFLALNLVLGTNTNGATNWLNIGGIVLQPSEFVKVAYIYVGASTLDRLYRSRNLFVYIAFSATCVGALALMGDFGTALIFFTTFLVISFMRSGSFSTVFLAVAGAAFAVFLILTVKPYIAQRFLTWGHIWEDPYGAGWQQTRALSAAASGALTGVGIGKGWLHTIFAADTDMVFCMLCEEFGLIIALTAMLALVALAFFTVKNAAEGRSSFYVIAACAAASMMLVQLALNVFGSTDILPFTGVTFPLVSKGGSSLISCWALLAFIKASDTRQNASFSVKLSAKRRFEEYEYDEEVDDE